MIACSGGGHYNINGQRCLTEDRDIISCNQLRTGVTAMNEGVKNVASSPAILPYARFRFNLKAKTELLFPPYKGSTFRGAFGNALKRVVCALRRNTCRECMLGGKCAYAYIFETPLPSGAAIMKKYEAAPHPFIIVPSLEKKNRYEPGEILDVGLTLIGRGIEYLPYFIYAFNEMGEAGIGKGSGKYELVSVNALSPERHSADAFPGDPEARVIFTGESKTVKKFEPDIIDVDAVLRRLEEAFKPSFFSGEKISGDEASERKMGLRFLTPTRIVYNEKLSNELPFHVIVRNLLRRLSLICFFHSDIDSREWPYRRIIEAAEKIRTVESKTFWKDWERYSSRQERKVRMGGVVGEAHYAGNLEPFDPFIRIGEVLHVGKGTAFGLGMYECF